MAAKLLYCLLYITLLGPLCFPIANAGRRAKLSAALNQHVSEVDMVRVYSATQ